MDDSPSPDPTSPLGYGSEDQALQWFTVTLRCSEADQAITVRNVAAPDEEGAIHDAIAVAIRAAVGSERGARAAWSVESVQLQA